MQTLPAAADTFIDRFSIETGVTYHYRINATDDSGHKSAYASISITARVPDAPTGLRANVASGSGVTLCGTTIPILRSISL